MPRPRRTDRPQPQTVTMDHVQRALRERADPAVAQQSRRFFKTGPGQYGEGDRFLGIRVPLLRRLARDFQSLPLPQTIALLRSQWHEARLLGLLIFIRRYRSGDEAEQVRIYQAYLDNTRHINNWDLVDVSAEHIVGAHLHGRGRRVLDTLARSESLWERRIAILATFHFIRRGEFAPTLRVARLLLNDPHDLIHKAVGWMLREVAKRDRPAAEAFLTRHCRRMPRTMLRYAIERFPPHIRTAYLSGKPM